MIDGDSRKAILACAEILEVSRDLFMSFLLPPGNYRTSKVAGCLAGLRRAINRFEGENDLLKGAHIALPLSSGSMVSTETTPSSKPAIDIGKVLP